VEVNTLKIINTLKWLEQWYLSSCSESSWENVRVIQISTLDNPGWSVSIDLHGTPLESKFYKPIHADNGENDWLECRVQSAMFKGMGSPNRLEDILVEFKDWVLSHQ